MFNVAEVVIGRKQYPDLSNSYGISVDFPSEND